MQAHPRSIFGVFDGKRRYVIPLFQRQYVWDKERQWELLWEDIRVKADEALDQRADRPPHFLGAIVINQIPTFGDAVPAHDVIDGQQRLTTFQILLAALRDVALGTNAQVASELDLYTTNTGMMARPDEEKYKVWPTEADVPVFLDVMNLRSLDAVNEKYPRVFKRKGTKVRPKIVQAYVFFNEQIAAYVLESPGDAAARTRALYDALRTRLQLVSIELETNDDPQVIFETLNARGEPLLPSDLLRNFVFLRAARQKEASSALYKKYWQTFDLEPNDVSRPNGDRFWKIEERYGRVTRARLDIFMQHFLALKRRQEVNIGALYREYRSWIQAVQALRHGGRRASRSDEARRGLQAILCS